MEMGFVGGGFLPWMGTVFFLSTQPLIGTVSGLFSFVDQGGALRSAALIRVQPNQPDGFPFARFESMGSFRF